MIITFFLSVCLFISFFFCSMTTSTRPLSQFLSLPFSNPNVRFNKMLFLRKLTQYTCTVNKCIGFSSTLSLSEMLVSINILVPLSSSRCPFCHSLGVGIQVQVSPAVRQSEVKIDRAVYTVPSGYDGL